MVSENSTYEPVLLAAEREVPVVGTERHQHVLARYAPSRGTADRLVTAELQVAPVADGPHAGERGIEVLLDGHRVGELTFRLAQTYGHVLDRAARDGRRAVCRASVRHGRRGLVELDLQLPHLGTLPPLPAQRGSADRAVPAPSAPAAKRGRKWALWCR